MEDRLHIITSQPLIEGVHPNWKTLVEGLERQGLVHENPLSKIPNFLMDGGPAGEITVTDLHENNVIESWETRLLHPIDGHFYFDDVQSRLAALDRLGL